MVFQAPLQSAVVERQFEAMARIQEALSSLRLAWHELREANELSEPKRKVAG